MSNITVGLVFEDEPKVTEVVFEDEPKEPKTTSKRTGRKGKAADLIPDLDEE